MKLAVHRIHRVCFWKAGELLQSAKNIINSFDTLAPVIGTVASGGGADRGGTGPLGTACMIMLIAGVTLFVAGLSYRYMAAAVLRCDFRSSIC